MPVREIITLPNPILRRKAHKITGFDKDLQTLINDMVETMRDEPGVGIAAPQVGISSRLIVVEWGDEDDEGNPLGPKKLFVVINPEMTINSEEKETAIEGCLSIPDLQGEVERYTNITVKGLNRFGKPTKIKAEDWLARIFQHEMDHLDGVLFPDRATKVWKATNQPADDEESEDEPE